MISPQEIGGGSGVFALLLGTLAADRGSGIYTRGSSGGPELPFPGCGKPSGMDGPDLAVPILRS
jgi:hypothetical protein